MPQKEAARKAICLRLSIEYEFRQEFKKAEAVVIA